MGIEERVLLTGAGGGMGQLLVQRLSTPGRILRLLDLSPFTAPTEGAAEVVVASVSDLDAMLEACDGVDAIIHLAGHSKEAPFDEILESNVRGSYAILEAAHRMGVRRVVMASSNHAVGYVDRLEVPAEGLQPDIPAHPDSYYGWSKASMELLGRLYADKYGMDVFSIRIGWCFPDPIDVRGLAHWMSPDDAGRLIEA